MRVVEFGNILVGVMVVMVMVLVLGRFCEALIFSI